MSVVKSDGCWLWTGHTVRGYGEIGLGGRAGRNLKAHRVSWELANGPIPPGLLVCHHCDTPACVNPAHLFLGTVRDNALDASRKGRLNQPTKAHKGEANCKARLTAADIAAIRDVYAAHRGKQYVKRGTATMLARRFGVHPDYLKRIVDRKAWAHV